MLPQVTQFEDTVILVGDTGIQFMDFALRLDPRKLPAGDFAPLTNGLLCRLEEGERNGMTSYFYESEPGKTVEARSTLNIGMDASLKLFDGLWLPLPVFRHRPPFSFDQGPINWSRMRLVRLAEPDIDGNTHRLTVAFDTRTRTEEENRGCLYLGPMDTDASSGVSFKLACKPQQARWFLDQIWVKEWLLEVFKEGHPKTPRDELDKDIKEGHPEAHYLNLLSLFMEPCTTRDSTTPPPQVKLPEMKIVASHGSGVTPPIPVDLVLDVGNSRTCGILIENHGQSGSGLKDNYVLELRDLMTPEHVYNDAFESRVEFAQAAFGKDESSTKSGRADAFQWPTMARVGREAGRLASRRRGTEGSTGLSSPKRYLWDENPYDHGWRFSHAYVKTDKEPFATAPPFSLLINETGDALHSFEWMELPVFVPRYSRSSLMTFMLAEVLTHALMQINSPAQRSRQGHTRVPRRLNSITLTVPPGMPQAERSILEKRMRHAIGLVWKALGWQVDKKDPFDPDSAPATTPLPNVRVEWDEASCGQLVYLYTEVNENFAGHPEEFFDAISRPGKTDRERITLATIDIGGGTTDLVITDYRLDRAGNATSGSNVHIVPEQRFRDGFKVAGDDILLDVIQDFILPSFDSALLHAGVNVPASLMSRLCGAESGSAQDQVLRQQLNLQVFTPLALELLRRYELFNPEFAGAATDHTYLELLGNETVSSNVLDYVNSAVRRELGMQTDFDLLKTAITFDLQALHVAFTSGRINITKILSGLCEVIAHYPCDMLLLTGRPSRLPGIQAFIRKMLPLPPGRILALQNYRTGNWYPFHKNGLIDDPKSTASVGAMLCLLCANHSVPNFYFRTSALKPYSTIKHIGKIDQANIITDSDVLYRDLTSDNGRIVLPEIGEGLDARPPALQMRGDMRLGFRQLAAERWSATPLYTLHFTPQGRQRFTEAKSENNEMPVVNVYFKVLEATEKMKRQGQLSDLLEIDQVESNTDKTFSKKDLSLQLNTTLVEGLSGNKYWLDSGSVKRK
ncbi:virulence factor SrfB [Pseudomonas weihenstephanensis]|uniref:virulence factor SrfB n=1 Tax=Pseudomonas weihenstephanensis TaxID=1608994 RepID=UPI00065353B5|nr:virulence factor SrfB [Pseudomonas weihenstephanensis]KMN17491.1 virulence factor SrfB [Pseudomonas weihenstephanensis]GLX89733.1 virulence factor SrfB [Pseudomonas fragi]